MKNWWNKPEIHDAYERQYRQLIIVPAVRPEPTKDNPALWNIDPETFEPQRRKDRPS